MNQQQKETDATENDLVSYLENKVGHLKPYWSHITLGICIVILGAIASVYLVEQSRAGEAAKWQELYIAQQNYRNTLDNESFKLHAETFPDELPGQWSLLYAADAETRAGLSDFLTNREAGFDKLKKAQGYYQKVLDNSASASQMLVRRATFGLAYALESTGDFQEAEKYYGQIVEAGDNNPLLELATRGLDRVRNEDYHDVFQQFKDYVLTTEEDAPGMDLPKRPDISFPENTEQPNSGGGEFSANDETDEGDSTNEGSTAEESSGNSDDESDQN